MPGFRILEFKGLTPRYASVRTPLGTAAVAHDVDLSRGSIEAWRTPKPIAATLGVKALHKTPDCLLTDSCPNAWYADSTPDCDMVIKSGDGLPPRWNTREMACAGQWVRLGLPCPASAPVVPLISAGSPTAAARFYVAVFEDDFGNLGPASFPSDVIPCESGTPVSVSAIPQPPAGWNVAAVRLYRSIRPFADENADKAVDGAIAAHTGGRMSHLALVVRLNIGVSAYTDIVPDGNLGETYVSDEHSAPPADLQQIVVMETGAAVGFRGKELWFSDPFTHHGWPEKHKLILDDNIRAICTRRDWVYVATDGHPYSVQELPREAPPNANVERDWRNFHAGNRQVWRHPEPHPICSKRSMCDWQEGGMFATNEGLLLLEGKSNRLVTAGWYSPTDWKAIWPHTGIGQRWGTRFVFATEKATLLFDLLKDTIASDNTTLSTLSIRPTAMFCTRAGALLYADDTGIHQFNAGTQLQPYTWEQDAVTFPVLVCLSAAKVVADTVLGEYAEPVTMTYKVNGKVKQSRLVRKVLPFRLPRSTGLNATIAASGIVRITEIHAATSVADLGQSGGADSRPN